MTRFSEDIKNPWLKATPSVSVLGEYGSEVSYFIPEPRNFAEVTRLSEDIKKYWLKSTLKKIKNSIKNQIFRVQDSKNRVIRIRPV